MFCHDNIHKYVQNEFVTFIQFQVFCQDGLMTPSVAHLFSLSRLDYSVPAFLDFHSWSVTARNAWQSTGQPRTTPFWEQCLPQPMQERRPKIPSDTSSWRLPPWASLQAQGSFQERTSNLTPAQQTLSPWTQPHQKPTKNNLKTKEMQPGVGADLHYRH